MNAVKAQHNPGARFFALSLVVLLFPPAAVWAAAPTLSSLTPFGAQRGTETEITANGQNLDDAVELLFYEPGITQTGAPHIEGRTATFPVSIAPDCRVGTHALRVRTGTGITSVGLFSVGNLPERDEVEPNNLPSEAEPVELNTTINGVITAEDMDYFSVELEEGERLAVEIEALRLGRALFDPKLWLYGPDGHELLAVDDTLVFQQDAGFVHVAEQSGRHLIAVGEASYGGSNTYAYRLHIGDFPRPLGVTPMGGPPGTEMAVSWIGDPKVAEQQVLVPAVDYDHHPLVAQVGDALSPTGLPFRVSALPIHTEVEPNNIRAEATPVTVPAAFEGVIGEPGDIDFYRFSVEKGQTFQIKVWARDLGSPLDSVIQIFDPEGKNFASNDDSNGLDSFLAFAPTEGGEYTLSIRDHLRRGGPFYTYRVEVEANTPHLRMSLLENEDISLHVPQGNRSFLLVNATRRGPSGDVTVTLDGLPEGLRTSDAVIPTAQTTHPVMVYAAEDAPLAGALTRVVGAQQMGEDDALYGELQQNYRLVRGRNNTTFFGRDLMRLAVVVGDPAPFTVDLLPPKAPFVRNGHRNLVVKAVRAEGYNEPINLRFPWLPTGMSGGTATIPADADTATIRLEVQGSAPVGQHNVFVQATAPGYTLCTDWTPVEVQDQWVTFEIGEFEAEQGQPTELTVALQQHQPYDGEWEVALTGLPNGISTENLRFNNETTELVFSLQVAESAPEGKFGPLVARAEIVLNEEPVAHNSGAGNLQVYKPLPPELQAQQPEIEAVEEEPDQPRRRTRFSS